MKKIYSFVLFAAFALAFSACSGDYDQVGSEYSRPSTVKVLSSNLVFSAAAGTGTLVFEAPSAATVSVDAQWATAVVNGNKVDVSVKKNTELEGRSALLTVKCGNDSALVTVQQRGMAFKYCGESTRFVHNDAAGTITVPVKNEGSVLSIKGLDWAEASINDEAITIKLSENKSGHIRSGFIKYTYGPRTDSVNVCQGEKKDIVNKEYLLSGFDLNQVNASTKDLEEVRMTLQVVLKEVDGRLVIDFPKANWTLPITFDEASLSFFINAGERLGVLKGKYHMVAGVIDRGYQSSFEENNVMYLFASPESKFSISGTFNYSEKFNGAVSFLGDNNFNDDFIKQLTKDPSAEFDANTLGFLAFKSAEVSQNSYVGPAALLFSPLLLEYTPKPAKGTVLKFGMSATPDESYKQAVLEHVKQQLRTHPFSRKFPSGIGKLLR